MFSRLMMRVALAGCFAFGLLQPLEGLQLEEALKLENAHEARTKRVRETLDQTFITVDYVDQRFEDVIQELSKSTETNFLIHESATDNQLDGESLIGLKLKDVRVATLLDHLLNQFDCSWIVQDGIVLIVSTDHSLDCLQVRVFDCSDIASKIKPKVTRLLRARGGSGGHIPSNGRANGMGGGVFAIPDSMQQENAVKTKTAEAANVKLEENLTTEPQVDPRDFVEFVEKSGAEQLCDMLENVIDSDSWDVSGGNGRVEYLNGILVVRQTTDNIRAIERLLDRLRNSDLMNSR